MEKTICNIPNIQDDSMIFEDDKLFQLCDVFGEDDQLHDQEILLEDNSINMENEECTQELVRKHNPIARKGKCSEEDLETRSPF